jgi:undecaprenyl diphosphate synthase
MQEREIRSDRLPRHVAIIMDGNGRWAESRGLDRNLGHREGIEAVRATVRGANDLGIHYLTLYAFSLENWSRPEAEVRELMRLLEYYIDAEIEEVMEKSIRVRSIGRLDRLPDGTRHAIEDAVRRSAGNTEMTLTFALSYGGRAEITDATRKIVRDVERGHLDPEAIDEKVFASYLYQPDLPEPDLLIRTGGEWRVSNFLLWQIAYSEIYTTSVMWPDFREEHLVEAILEYGRRERRFGQTSAQVRQGSEGTKSQAAEKV